jgi:autotransporter-associated beta strand protein
MRHGLAKFDQLRWISRPNYRPYRAVLTFARRGPRKIFDVSRNVRVNRSTVALHVLQHSATGIRRLHQHKNPRAPFVRDFHKRLEAVIAQIRTHRERIGMPRAFVPQIPAGVRFRGASDIIPLTIEDHQQSPRPRVVDHLRHRLHAKWPKLFEERCLHFYDGHQCGYGITYTIAEPHVRICNARSRLNACWQQTGRQILAARVETHAHRIARAVYCSAKSINKVFHNSFDFDGILRPICRPRKRLTCGCGKLEPIATQYASSRFGIQEFVVRLRRSNTFQLLAPQPASARWGYAAMIAVAHFVFVAAAPAIDLHFDYTSFDNANTAGANPHFGQAQFNVLNYPSINGNYMMTSTDNHRPEMVAAGNDLAEFYNNFLVDYNTQFRSIGGLNASAEADAINAYVVKNSANNGSRPPWLILNEISASVWPDDTQKGTDYRAWVIDAVTRLHDNFGYNVVTYSPFPNPGAHGSDWQALATKSYIGVENYLSGVEVMSAGSNYASRLAWAESQYQLSKDKYGALGVDPSRLFLGEDFTNNTSGNGFGRGGLSSSADWDTAIQIRQDAIYNVGFAGFLAYAWGGNPLGISEAEQIEHEYYYRSRLVLPGQKPQWLSDSAINVNGTTIPLSWNQPLNWLGGVPNANRAQANFWRTLTAARTITLDGNKTIGSMLFDSAYTYTITAGSGGSIIFNNSGSPATLTSSQGSHVIGVDLQLASNLTATISTGTLKINGMISGVGSLTKTGAGSLALIAANTYTGDTLVQAGTLSLATASLADSADVYVSNGGLLEMDFTDALDVIDSLFLNGVMQRAGIWGPVGSGAQFTSPLLTGTGELQVTTFIVPPLLGDYNRDGIVDTADYALWRNSVGSATLPNRDPSNVGPISQADYNTWRQHFGQSVLGSGSGLLEGSVPEPAVCPLFCWLVGVTLLSRRRKGKFPESG